MNYKIMQEKLFMTKEEITQAQQEFDEKEGFVTIEYSIHVSKLKEFEEILKQIESSKLGIWVLRQCDTCVEYHGEGFLHLSLEFPWSIEEMKNSKNGLIVLTYELNKHKTLE